METKNVTTTTDENGVFEVQVSVGGGPGIKVVSAVATASGGAASAELAIPDRGAPTTTTAPTTTPGATTTAAAPQNIAAISNLTVEYLVGGTSGVDQWRIRFTRTMTPNEPFSVLYAIENTTKGTFLAPTFLNTTLSGTYEMVVNFREIDNGDTITVTAEPATTAAFPPDIVTGSPLSVSGTDVAGKPTPT